ncbi:MAG: hypothetical protein ACK4UN_09195 [Limisphaerales bacterium]
MSQLILSNRLDTLMAGQNALLFFTVFCGIIYLWNRRLARKQQIAWQQDAVG